MKSLWVLVLLTGCTSIPITDEQEYNRQIRLENWALCEKVYEQNEVPTYHSNHTHMVRMSARRLDDAIRDDLALNGCKSILKDYWADPL